MRLSRQVDSGNWDLKIGQRYMYDTFYGMADLFAAGQGEEGDPGQPLKFKLYRDVVRYPLSQRLPLALGDVRWSFEEFRSALDPAPCRSDLDVESLSTLLYYAYGLSRVDTGPGAPWPLHRLVPSARCFFPTELYAWLPQTGHIPAGIYHYDNLHHLLSSLRLGDYQDELARMLGADLVGASCVLLFSSLFWKNAFKYRNYSYRLCTQEAGMVVGNALMVGGTLGLQGQVHYQFLDEPVNRLLGCEQFEESVLAVLPMYPRLGDELHGIKRKHGVVNDREFSQVGPIAHSYAKVSSFNSDLCGLVKQMDQNSYLNITDEFAIEQLAPVASSCERLEGDVPAMPVTDLAVRGYVELASALHSRDSGNVLFNPTGEPIMAMDMWEILACAVAPYVRDTGQHLSKPFAHLYVVINRVEGITKGLYRLCSDCGALHVLRTGDVSVPFQEILGQPNIHLGSSNMAVYVTADYAAVSETFGNRAYRILNMEGGLIAQRICAVSAANGLSARVSNGYRPAETEELLGLTSSSLTPFFQIIIGYNRPGVRYGLSIRF